MHNAIAHHPLTNAQTIPSSRPPIPASHPYILFSMTSDGMEYPFGQFGSAALGLSPPSSCCAPSLPACRFIQSVPPTVFFIFTLSITRCISSIS